MYGIALASAVNTSVLEAMYSRNIYSEEITLTKTQWNAGQFAWDGMDSNFLMVGLLTSLGVFIALGIYSRRSKSSVWPLMLVAGGAAFLFLIMM